MSTPNVNAVRMVISKPNSRNATKTDSSVKIVRIFFRQRLLHRQGEELHAAAPINSPFSRCSVRLARSAACGSCVTITMVLP